MRRRSLLFITKAATTKLLEQRLRLRLGDFVDTLQAIKRSTVKTTTSRGWRREGRGGEGERGVAVAGRAIQLNKPS